MMSTAMLNIFIRTVKRRVESGESLEEILEKIDYLENHDLKDYLVNLCNDYNFDSSKSTGLVTLALMKNLSIVSKKFKNLEVSAITTAGVRVNAVAPGFIVNERSKLILGTVEEGLTKRGQDVINHTPMGNFGKASDMSGAVKYLLDDRASGFVTGITMPVDGGFLTLSGV